MRRALAIVFSVLILAAIGIHLLATPPTGYIVGQTPNDVFTHNTSTGSVLVDPEQSYIPSNLTFTGSGTVTSISASGSYSQSPTAYNSQPVYSSTNGLTIWSISNSGSVGSVTWPANAWLLTGSASLGGSPTSGLSAGTGSINSGLTFSGTNSFGTTTGTYPGSTAAPTFGLGSGTGSITVPTQAHSVLVWTTGGVATLNTSSGTAAFSTAPIQVPMSGLGGGTMSITGTTGNYLFRD